ncbi:Hypothetical predicted protein [Mytilus galloprovincialis]|uniref:Uncharacterized protein n=1 Tax=Mytilus galloprovincialis TaxID=29158 RepID=A0A8B6GME4_MYTGA|nr:Hypothetical predicted protein [Mytilus galloprovincialis]
MAIKQIVKNIKKLADLQTIDLSLIFCVRDEVQKRQLIKYCGHGEFLQRLKNVEPVLKQEEFVKSTSYEEFLPKVQAQAVKYSTPSKLSCGPGVSKNLAHQQKQQLEETEVIPVEHEKSITLVVNQLPMITELTATLISVRVCLATHLAIRPSNVIQKNLVFDINIKTAQFIASNSQLREMQRRMTKIQFYIDKFGYASDEKPKKCEIQKQIKRTKNSL